MSADFETVDLLVIGGGINGTGIARDAAGRGLSVLLAEQGDLAGATSSASTKLIHGGLRYLEQWEFRLVREALVEREVLLRAAPHIIRPLRFVLPHGRGLRPAWMIRLGLFLYDHLGGRERLPGSQPLDLRHSPTGVPLDARFRKGFVYSDCWVDDARLVVLNARDAAERGATVLTRTRCTAARRVDGLWEVELRPAGGGEPRTLRARALVNAAGPWVRQVLSEVAGLERTADLRLVKGSHIVVPRLYEGEQAYILQNRDKRIVFTIPYEGRFTLVGTTDLAYAGDPAEVRIDAAEVAYLCAAVGRFFKAPVDPASIVWSYAGVRPLYDDRAKNASTVTRDYVLDLDTRDGAAPLLSVFGGKLTTYRKLAEQALGKLAPLLGCTVGPWTEAACLPGGDMPDADFEAFATDARARYPWLPPELRQRLLRAYGSRIARVLGPARGLDDLGEDLGGGLSEAELAYLQREEWAETAEDVLWRRSKLGLHVPAGTAERVAEWLGEHERAAPLGNAAR